MKINSMITGKRVETISANASIHDFDIMTAEVFTCTADSTVAELMIMMTEHRIRHVPVVDAQGGLLSIVSIGDVVKSYVSEIDSERTALRDYVTGGN